MNLLNKIAKRIDINDNDWLNHTLMIFFATYPYFLFKFTTVLLLGNVGEPAYSRYVPLLTGTIFLVLSFFDKFKKKVDVLSLIQGVIVVFDFAILSYVIPEREINHLFASFIVMLSAFSGSLKKIKYLRVFSFISFVYVPVLLYKDGIKIHDGPMYVSLFMITSLANHLITFLRIRTEIELKNKNCELQTTKASMLANSQMAALGEMASNIGHEINNPLNLINAQAEYLEDSFEDNENALKRLDSIKKNSERISKIIAAMKRLSRKESGQLKKPLKLYSIIEDIQTIMSDKIKNESFTIEYAISKDTEIFCIQSEIGQVLINLVNNAIYARPSGTQVYLIVHDVLDKVIISAIDEGPGVSSEINDKLFTPFTTTKPPDKGTGLGLSISKKIAEDHGGNLSYNRKNNKTYFILELPIYRKKENL